MSKEVTAQIWRWKEAGLTPAAKTHSKPALRAVIQAAVVAGIGWLFLWRGHKGMAIFLLAMGAFLFISGLFIPWLFLAVEKFGKKFGQWVGVALTWILLVPTFIIIFFPGRLILWLTRRDPMRRQFPSREETYWVPRPPVEKIEQYSKQF
jgi:hypothetical protein